jgi:hypothetical protein
VKDTSFLEKGTSLEKDTSFLEKGTSLEKDTSFLAKDTPCLVTWMVLEMSVALDGHRLTS